GFLEASNMRSDQAAARRSLRRRLRIIEPVKPKPSSMVSQLAGSGTLPTPDPGIVGTRNGVTPLNVPRWTSPLELKTFATTLPLIGLLPVIVALGARTEPNKATLT